MQTPFNPQRRSFLSVLASVAAAAGLSGFLPGFVRRAAAMGERPRPDGMRTTAGKVRLNGSLVEAGAFVTTGDVIETGPESRAIFVLGKDAFLLHGDSHVRLVGDERNGTRGALSEIRLKAGRLLSVFGPGPMRIVTTTAVCGIRGTGIYVESYSDRSYVCTCYGVVDISALDDPTIHETVRTVHHEAPRFIFAPGVKDRITAAPMLGHTDDELVMLESLVDRRPPFLEPLFPEGSGFNH